MASRPVVAVYNGTKSTSHVVLPNVLTAPIRPDVVQDVFKNLNKNHRQPYSVSKYAGHQTSAESWGTGRAVARIPRVSGGGTSRSGQGAFGNMCRGGRMFAPTKIWRRWHRRPSVNQRRYALTSALAGSALPALVLARGHRVERVAEVPLVLDVASLANVEKTSAAVALLKSVNAYDDVLKAKNSRTVRGGHGKVRNRRYVQRRGPLVVYNEKSKFVYALRNLPGVELVNVKALNLLQLAPGGHVGRFVVWTKDAFTKLDSLYHAPRSLVSNPDVNRIVNSNEVQSALKDRRPRVSAVHARRKNALTNSKFAAKLNPYVLEARKNQASLKTPAAKARRAGSKSNKAFRKALLANVARKA
jgi:large subunit ribosomal protein L4e